MENTQKSSARDFFLYLAVIVALYISVASTLMLLFTYINTLFPDVLDYYQSFGDVTGPMASLIVAFPVYIFLTRFLNQDLRAHSEKRELWIRRWLIYLTLFLAGVMIFVNFITLVRYFLNGETTVRFILKVLSVFVVSGAVFWYYFLDIKGKWDRDVKHSILAGYIAGIAVLAIIVSGFVIVGTPKELRAVRIDQERVSDLQNIQWQIVNYWQSKDTLPEQLSDLEDSISGYVAPTDPETEVAYSYEITGPLSFTLCATFATESREGELGNVRYIEKPIGGVEESWAHEAGEECFDRDIDPELYKLEPTFR